MRCVLVDPNLAWLEASRRVIDDAIALKTFVDFRSAREQLLKTPPHFLATNLRLGPYNGLHLVYLAKAAGTTRCVVYSDRPDLALVREAQCAGAFYEDASRVAYAIRSYANGPLPDLDRRSPDRKDRRQRCRGSRRSADWAVLYDRVKHRPLS